MRLLLAAVVLTAASCFPDWHDSVVSLLEPGGVRSRDLCSAGKDNDELFGELFGKPDLGCGTLMLIGQQGVELCKNGAVRKACSETCKHPCVAAGNCAVDDDSAVKSMLSQLGQQCGAESAEKCTCQKMMFNLQGKENLCSTKNGMFWSCACGYTCGETSYGPPTKREKQTFGMRSQLAFASKGDSIMLAIKKKNAVAEQKSKQDATAEAKVAAEQKKQLQQQKDELAHTKKRAEALANDPETKLETVPSIRLPSLKTPEQQQQQAELRMTFEEKKEAFDKAQQQKKEDEQADKMKSMKDRVAQRLEQQQAQNQQLQQQQMNATSGEPSQQQQQQQQQLQGTDVQQAEVTADQQRQNEQQQAQQEPKLP